MEPGAWSPSDTIALAAVAASVIVSLLSPLLAHRLQAKSDASQAKSQREEEALRKSTAAIASAVNATLYIYIVDDDGRVSNMMAIVGQLREAIQMIDESALGGTNRIRDDLRGLSDRLRQHLEVVTRQDRWYRTNDLGLVPGSYTANGLLAAMKERVSEIKADNASVRPKSRNWSKKS